MNRDPSSGLFRRSLQRLYMIRRPHHRREPVLYHSVRILRLHPAHHQHVSIVLPKSPPNPRSVVNVAHSQPCHAGVDQHRRNQLRTVAVAVGLDDREHVGIFTGGRTYRGDVVSQARP